MKRGRCPKMSSNWNSDVRNCPSPAFHALYEHFDPLIPREEAGTIGHSFTEAGLVLRPHSAVQRVGMALEGSNGTAQERRRRVFLHCRRAVCRLGTLPAHHRCFAGPGAFLHLREVHPQRRRACSFLAADLVCLPYVRLLKVASQPSRCITTNRRGHRCGRMKEYFDGNPIGHICAPRDVHALTEAIRSALSAEPVEAASIARNRFSWAALPNNACQRNPSSNGSNTNRCTSTAVLVDGVHPKSSHSLSSPLSSWVSEIGAFNTTQFRWEHPRLDPMHGAESRLCSVRQTVFSDVR